MNCTACARDVAASAAAAAAERHRDLKEGILCVRGQGKGVGGLGGRASSEREMNLAF